MTPPSPSHRGWTPPVPCPIPAPYPSDGGLHGRHRELGQRGLEAVEQGLADRQHLHQRLPGTRKGWRGWGRAAGPRCGHASPAHQLLLPRLSVLHALAAPQPGPSPAPQPGPSPARCTGHPGLGSCSCLCPPGAKQLRAAPALAARLCWATGTHRPRATEQAQLVPTISSFAAPASVPAPTAAHAHTHARMHKQTLCTPCRSVLLHPRRQHPTQHHWHLPGQCRCQSWCWLQASLTTQILVLRLILPWGSNIQPW